MIGIIHRQILPIAYSLLPPQMNSDRATAFILAIGLQESTFQHRIQIGAPMKGRGFWQFEGGKTAGIDGVLTHPRTRHTIADALVTLRYAHSRAVCHSAVAHNDVLAAVFARLLLYTLPQALPGPNDPDGAWEQYMDAWRPGKPHRDTWNAYYKQAWDRVSTQPFTVGVSSMAAGIAPNLKPIVERVAQQHEIDFRRCGRPDIEYPDNTFFAGLVVLEIYKNADNTGDPAMIAQSRRFGLNGKRGNPNDLSKDAISYQRVAGNLVNVDVIDIVNSSGTLNDDGTLTDEAEANGEAPSSPAWNNMGNEHPGHWVDPDVLWEDQPEPPEPPESPTIPDYEAIGGDAVFIEKIGKPLESDCAQVGQTLNAGSAVWFGRSSYDAIRDMAVNGTDPTEALDASVAKHRAEWRAVLGLPPL